MSVSGILSNNLFACERQTTSSNLQQFKEEFQQLGEDLQSGTLSAAQSDFVTLQQLPQAQSNSPAQSSNPLSQAMSQLSQDLQSGNLSAAQQDYANIKQDIQSQVARMHYHHHQGGQTGQISQLFQQLGQELQSGDLTSAQQTYATLRQDLQVRGSRQSSSQSSSSSAVFSHRLRIPAPPVNLNS